MKVQHTNQKVTIQVMEKDDPSQIPITLTIQKQGATTKELMRLASQTLQSMNLQATPLMMTLLPVETTRKTTSSRTIQNCKTQ